MSAFRVLPAVITLGLLATSARGIYLPAEIEKVPVERWTANLAEAQERPEEREGNAQPGAGPRHGLFLRLE